ncbi:MAG TPA: carbonic anhydrase family protein [Casimicrobiaceae bacterium]|nr:carbonic anhydrase family protein [Casimicrobiaceae bacterium]
MKRFIAAIVATGFASVLVVVAPSGIAAEKDKNWAYTGANGPTKWAKLDKAFATCGSGQLQAPIDIPDAHARKGDLPPLLFNYKPAPLKIIDDGHTIQVNFAPDSWVSIEGKRYELVEARFHKPSEMKINGKGQEMDVQLVHKDKDGKLAIITVLLDQGNENALIKTLWSNLPQTKEKENVVAGVQINAFGLLPQNKEYYTFKGSLTTPPCTEGVSWYVLKTPGQISADQVARFGRLYPANARPTQPLNDRDILGPVSR